MIERQTVFEIHRLHHLGFKERKIARTLRISRPTVRRYLKNPQPQKPKISRRSKLDPYQERIQQLLEKDPEVKAPVVLQRLQQEGFDGKITILRDCLRRLRGRQRQPTPFIRFESKPGQQMQIDWGHFGVLAYKESMRKLYALAVIEGYSRAAYVEFTHSQNQACLHQALLNALAYFGGSPQEVVVDNMLSAVTERQGPLIRFNDAFFDFLRIFHITPIACNVASPHEKGKIENFIKYLRQNFWPLRTFSDLCDVNGQVRHWLDTVANIRIHQTTGKRPLERLAEVHLRPLPDLLPDCRQTEQLKVYKDFAVRFDANVYTTPPWAIGKKVTLKANQSQVSIYYQEKKIAGHNRCWQRGMRIETPSHKEQVKKLKRKLWRDKDIAAFSSLGAEAVAYLEALARARQPIKKNVSKLLALKDDYGSVSVIYAIKKALIHNAIGADYIENILYQEMTPKRQHPPVRLKKENLNQIRLSQPSLVEYDAHVIKRIKK
ncbi:MAG: IS21 family transposase [Deltaproteobacteria bacterium]|jgi:transposase|nr:IS21 family transposase [Deltaproteobacteria bacterium]